MLNPRTKEGCLKDNNRKIWWGRETERKESMKSGIRKGVISGIYEIIMPIQVRNRYSNFEKG